MISCRQSIRWMISFAITYAGAAFAPKIAVIGVFGRIPSLISKYLSIIYSAFNCCRLYSWSLFTWISKIVSASISIACVSFRYAARSFLFSFLISKRRFKTVSSSLYSSSLTILEASSLYSSLIVSSSSAVRRGLQWRSHLRNVIPFVLLLNLSG